MSTAKQSLEVVEPRIYVIIAESVQVQVPIGPGTFHEKTIYQPCGRAMAQGEHVVSLMKMTRLSTAIYKDFNKGKFKPESYIEYYQPTTTINLAARSSKELDHIAVVLHIAGINYHPFFDDNEDVYGKDEHSQPIKIMTAVCTEPVQPAKVKDLLGYLPLWNHGKC